MWAPVLAGAVLVVFLLVLAVPAGREAFRDARAVDLSAAQLLWRVLVRVPLGTVLLEETAFRGVLWAMIRRRHGTAWATGVSSLLFGLWHLLPSRGLGRSNTAVATAFGSGSADVAPTVTLAVVAMVAAGVSCANCGAARTACWHPRRCTGRSTASATRWPGRHPGGGPTPEPPATRHTPRVGGPVDRTQRESHNRQHDRQLVRHDGAAARPGSDRMRALRPLAGRRRTACSPSAAAQAVPVFFLPESR